MRLFVIWIIGLVSAEVLPAQAREYLRPSTTKPAAQPAFKVPTTWEYSAPLIAPQKREKDASHAQKDPSIVFHEGKWHVFMTIKGMGFTGIEHCSFDKWENAGKARRTVLKLSDSKYYGAPQVFYFRPHKKWYLVYQLGLPGLRHMWVAYSTTENIADPASWTKPQPILDGSGSDPRRDEGGLDYWIICDDKRAYLFYTSLNGKLWRAWTKLEDFPKGMGNVELALKGPFFEASHTYKLKGLDKYLTIVEENGRRYYKAYLADSLDGKWTPLADTAQHPFAGWVNIRPAKGVVAWADNVSHGELVREGSDETMTVDPLNLRFVFQGLLERDKAGKGYGQFPWRIGMMTPAKAAGP